jgi:hypothetical protein
MSTIETPFRNFQALQSALRSVTITRIAIFRFLPAAAMQKPLCSIIVVLYRRHTARQTGGRRTPERKMAINDRRSAATMTHRRNFLIGIASLIAAPAVVRAEALMPIVVWRPTFWQTRNVGMGPFLSCRADELIGIDLRSLGLPKPATFSGAPGQLFWSYRLHPLESLPQDRIRIPRGPRNAALAAASTNHPIGGLALAASRALPPNTAASVAVMTRNPPALDEMTTEGRLRTLFFRT